MLNRHALTTVLLSSLSAACGAKTGLRVPDVQTDVALDTPIDVTDAGDAGDVVDADVLDVQMCVPMRSPLDRRGSELMFVIDRSNSMAFALDGGTAMPPARPQRWTVLRDAFAASLPRFDSTVAVGAKFYPIESADPNNQTVDEACSAAGAIDLAPVPSNSAALLDVFRRTQPAGGTPTFEAVTQTVQYLRARTGRGQARYIVLATDGGPNCNGMIPDDPRTCVCTSNNRDACTVDEMFGRFNCLDDRRTVAAIRESATPADPALQSIPVFVVGIDDMTTVRTDLLDVLDRMAVAGGRPLPEVPGRRRYYSARRPEDLTSAFDSIARSVARCAFVTRSAPTMPDATRITVGGVEMPRDRSRTEGWDWTDEAFGEVTFFGSACETANNDVSRVEAVLGCDDR